MAVQIAEFERDYEHPLTLVEASVVARGWVAERTGADELVTEVNGSWADYQLLFAWREDIAALHVTCAFDARMPDDRRAEIYELLALVNDRLWIGHFDVSGPERLPAFRHSLLLRGGIMSPIESLGNVYFRLTTFGLDQEEQDTEVTFSTDEIFSHDIKECLSVKKSPHL